MQLNNVKSTHHNHHYGYAIRNFAIEYLSQKQCYKMSTHSDSNQYDIVSIDK